MDLDDLMRQQMADLAEHYKKCPPQVILDDTGVRHVTEVDPPGVYKNTPCPCGITHDLESDTWFHKGIVLTADGKQIAVYRACKTCRVVLTRKLKDP